MPRRERAARGGFAGIAAVGLIAATLGGTATAAPDDTSAATHDGVATSADGTVTVTLLTGDTVRLDTVDGRRAVTIEPAEGREQIDIHQIEVDGELHVMPLDVVPFIGDDLLDRDLFNIDGLIAQGYDDASIDVLPVIATYDDDIGAADTGELEAASPGERFDSIDAQALTIDKDDADRFWESVTAGEVGAAGQAGKPALAGGVEKLWLDGQVEADLHESTTQIGAPAAWDAGIDGTGVTVAVLDTGVDSDHPDLAGQVVDEENFSSSDSADDRHGHGTHVAATVAGTGDGSDGLRKGVAPGADLISGKVLDDAGRGYESELISGMEWAVDAGADVVNMSLGGGPTDGTDPLSVAVNELSAANDVLFVVSAGNDGPSDYSIGSPGAADAALTVGAVDRDDDLADFSSRGPRWWNQVVKPDITAPGVGIVAARAEGTALGDPVDDHYTALNGTSMAAPHVAGAAALVAAQYPDLPNGHLKDMLISTAALGDLTPYEQGGGRVDVARAVTQPVTAIGTVYLGDFLDDETGTAATDITWTNTGDSDVDLTLELEFTDQNGEPAGDAVALETQTVTVPAQSTATVPVTVDVEMLPTGWYSGWVTATADDVVVHTTIAAIKQAPIHEVEIRGLNRQGDNAWVTPIAIFGEDRRFDVISFSKPGQPLTVQLGEGDYFLHAMISEDDQERSSVIVDPDLEITEDTELVLDARDANLIEIDTPQPAEPRGHLGFITYRDIGTRTITNSTMKFDGTSKIHVTPTEPAKDGYFEFTSRWQLSAPMLRADELGSRGLTLWPSYERYSPEAQFTRPLEVVDVGRGLAEDYEGRDVTDKAVVVHLTSKGQEGDAAQVAANEGAAMMLIAPAEGLPWWTKFTGRGNRLPLPVAVLSHDEVQEVAARLEVPRPLRLKFTGDQVVPYRYDVVQVSPNQVPEKVVHTVAPENTTTVTANYHEMGGENFSKEQRFAWRPWQSSTIVETQHELPTPQSRTEYISSGDAETLWRQHVLHLYSWDELNPIIGGAIHDLRTYEPGEEVTYDWYGGVQRPAIRADESSRDGDDLTIHVADFVQGDGELFARADSREHTGRVLEDGVVIGEGAGVWGTYRATKESATYQVEVSTERTGPDWEFSTHTDTTWTFASQRPADGNSAPLPMMRVDYDVPVGLDNRVDTAQPFHDVRFTAAHPGFDTSDRPEVVAFEAWTSHDDGATWRELDLSPTDDGRAFDARIDHQNQSGPVSLKVEVTDGDGNTMTQTVQRAYGLG